MNTREAGRRGGLNSRAKLRERAARGDIEAKERLEELAEISRRNGEKGAAKQRERLESLRLPYPT